MWRHRATRGLFDMRPAWVACAVLTPSNLELTCSIYLMVSGGDEP